MGSTTAKAVCPGLVKLKPIKKPALQPAVFFIQSAVDFGRRAVDLFDPISFG
ncbi:MAG: hypothetical protein K6U11_07060 [bacterium]|nr:hypothetical protein [bacterium]